jgi:hypothetical protein
MFGTHSLRRTKASLIYRRTGSIWAVQLLLGHRKLESTVRYLGVEVDDALAIGGQWVSERRPCLARICQLRAKSLEGISGTTLQVSEVKRSS